MVVSCVGWEPCASPRGVVAVYGDVAGVADGCFVRGVRANCDSSEHRVAGAPLTAPHHARRTALTAHCSALAHRAAQPDHPCRRSAARTSSTAVGYAPRMCAEVSRTTSKPAAA